MFEKPYRHKLLKLLAILILANLGYAHQSLQAQQKNKMILNLAIIPHRSNLGNEKAYYSFISTLQKETGYEYRWVGSKTYDDVIEKIRNNEADIGYVGPFAYVEAHDKYGARLICRTLGKKNEAFYGSMILTRKDSGINSLKDLKGKRFSFTDPKSTSGHLFPTAALLKAGVRKSDLGEFKFVTRHVNSLLAVFQGLSDAGATSLTAVDKIEINFDELKVLWKSDPIYRGPWIARKNMPEIQFNKIQAAMLKISNLKNAKEIFQGLTTKGFVKGLDSDYDNVREVITLLELEQ